MKFLFFITCIAFTFSNILFGIFVQSEDNSNGLVSVDTTYGRVLGKSVLLQLKRNNSTENLLVKQFLGIPFAKAPIGNLRFKAPVEPDPWLTPRFALDDPKSCIQHQSTKNLNMSEDCLYLNVWVPESNDTNLPVMVYIYGGGFLYGTINSYNFTILSASEDVIVVSMNYRLGAFGFLFFDSEEIPGNMGIMDQDLALKWVNKNIENFGGDPNRVTLFGHSAGSASVGHHLLNPYSQHLFNRAILQSGSPYAVFGSDAKTISLLKSSVVVKELGCFNDSNLEDIFNCLREADVVDILKASFVTKLPLFPVQDNIFVLKDQQKYLNVSQDKAVLLGFTSDDGGGIASKLLYKLKNQGNNTFDMLVRYFAPQMEDHVIALLKYYYNDHCDSYFDYKFERMANRLFTDFLFMCSTTRLADDLAFAGIKTYLYQFMHRPKSSQKPQWVNSAHDDELKFVFGNVLGLDDFEEENLSFRMMSYWGSFAKHGDPNKYQQDKNEIPVEDIPVYINDTSINDSEKLIMDEWLVYTIEDKARLDIDLKSSVTSLEVLQKHQCEFWNTIFPRITANGIY